MTVVESLNALTLRLGAASDDEIPMPSRDFWKVPNSTPLDSAQASRWAGSLASTLRTSAEQKQWLKVTRILLVVLGVANHDLGLAALSKTLLPQLEHMYASSFVARQDEDAQNQISLPAGIWKSAEALQSATAFFEVCLELYSLSGPDNSSLRFLVRYLPPVVFVNPAILTPAGEDSVAGQKLAVAQDCLQKQAALTLVNIMDSDKQKAKSVVVAIERRPESVLLVLSAARTYSLRLSISFILKFVFNSLQSTSPFCQKVKAAFGKSKTWSAFAKMKLENDQSVRAFVDKSLPKNCEIAAYAGCQVLVNGNNTVQKRIEFDRNLVTMSLSASSPSTLGYHELSSFSASKSSGSVNFLYHDSLCSTRPWDVTIIFGSSKDFEEILKVFANKMPKSPSIPNAKCSIVSLGQNGHGKTGDQPKDSRPSRPIQKDASGQISSGKSSIPSDPPYEPPFPKANKRTSNGRSRGPKDERATVKATQNQSKPKKSTIREPVTNVTPVPLIAEDFDNHMVSVDGPLMDPSIRTLQRTEAAKADRSGQETDVTPPGNIISGTALRGRENVGIVGRPRGEKDRKSHFKDKKISPSTSYTLRDLTDAFEDQLREQRKDASKFSPVSDVNVDTDKIGGHKNAKESSRDDFDFAGLLDACREKSQRRSEKRPLSRPTSPVLSRIDGPESLGQTGLTGVVHYPANNTPKMQRNHLSDAEYFSESPTPQDNTTLEQNRLQAHVSPRGPLGLSKTNSPKIRKIGKSQDLMAQQDLQSAERSIDFIRKYERVLREFGDRRFSRERENYMSSINSKLEMDVRNGLTLVEKAYHETDLQQILSQGCASVQAHPFNSRSISKVVPQAMLEVESARSQAANRMSSCSSGCLVDNFLDEATKSRHRSLAEVTAATDCAEKDIHRDNRADRLIENLNSLLETE